MTGVIGLEINCQTHQALSLFRLPHCQPVLNSQDLWSWEFSKSEDFTTWGRDESPSSKYFEECPFKKSDYIFDQRPWKKEKDFVINDNYLISAHELLSWHPAHTMPCEAARHWYEVTEIILQQIPRRYLLQSLFLDSGNYDCDRYFHTCMELSTLQIAMQGKNYPEPFWIYEVKIDPINNPLQEKN